MRDNGLNESFKPFSGHETMLKAPNEDQANIDDR